MPDAIAQLEALNTEYQLADCGYDVLCGACMEPQGGGCSSEGVCVTYGPD